MKCLFNDLTWSTKHNYVLLLVETCRSFYYRPPFDPNSVPYAIVINVNQSIVPILYLYAFGYCTITNPMTDYDEYEELSEPPTPIPSPEPDDRIQNLNTVYQLMVNTNTILQQRQQQWRPIQRSDSNKENERD